jgi:hypothetical protein
LQPEVFLREMQADLVEAAQVVSLVRQMLWAELEQVAKAATEKRARLLVVLAVVAVQVKQVGPMGNVRAETVLNHQSLAQR